MESKLKTAYKQHKINLEMQRQTNMLNLFVAWVRVSTVQYENSLLF